MLYQTAGDLDRQRLLAAKVRLYLGHVKLRELATTGIVDYRVFNKDDILLGWLECKTRKYSAEQIDRWGGYMIDHAKWQRVRSSVVRFAFSKFYLAVALSDADYLLEVPDDSPLWDLTPEIGGRRDRNDPNDIEHVVKIPMKNFVVLL